MGQFSLTAATKTSRFARKTTLCELTATPSAPHPDITGTAQRGNFLPQSPNMFTAENLYGNVCTFPGLLNFDFLQGVY